MRSCFNVRHRGTLGRSQQTPVPFSLHPVHVLPALLPARHCAREHQTLLWGGATAVVLVATSEIVSATDLAQNQAYLWMTAVPGWLGAVSAQEHPPTSEARDITYPTTADDVAC